MVDKAKQAQDVAMAVGVPYTPFILFNGNSYEISDLQSIRTIIELAGISDRQYSECPATVIQSGKEYTATIQTPKGDIVVKLFADKAPLSVNSMVFLSREGWYKNSNFYYVIRSDNPQQASVAVGGDPSGTGSGWPGYIISYENPNALKFDKPGLMGMVNGSQFFITFSAQPMLDGQYSIIGEVVSGMDVVESLTISQADASGNLSASDAILDLTITEK
jgi:cyclophilin family peptidyl-prolyl cis-trans isomerase